MKFNPVTAAQRYGRLVTVADAGRSADGHRLWLCRCDCGKEVVRQSNNLKLRATPSCGCASRDIHVRHGMRGTREYASWIAAKRRCHQPDDKDYQRYGARGIQMCAEWRASFEAFHAYMGNRPKGMTLERQDTNGNYEPGNCVWATPLTQARNRRTSIHVNWRGELQPLAVIAADLGITHGAAYMRLKKGTLSETAS